MFKGKMTAIIDIIGREIIDSRGNPTVEVMFGSRVAALVVRVCHRVLQPVRLKLLNCVMVVIVIMVKAY